MGEGNRADRFAAAFCIGLAGLAAAHDAARAAEWRVRGAVTERFNYDTNVRLATQNEQDAWGLSTLPSLTLEGHTPRLDLNLNAGLDYTFYEGVNNLDSFDQKGNASLGYSWERARASLFGSVVHAATRVTEVEDTGLNFTNAERLIYSGGGSWSYAVTQRDRLGVRGNGSRSVADTSAIQDYSSYGGGIFWSRQVTERDTLEASGDYTRFIRTSGLDLKSHVAGGRLTYDHAFSPQFKTSLHAGGRYVVTDETVFNGITFVSDERSSSGVLAGISMTYLVERGELNGSYQRSIDASGVGRLQQRDLVRLSTKYRATPDISFDLTGLFIKQKSANRDVNDGRTYVSAEPGANWQFYRDFYFRMAYRFRTQKFDSVGDWAVSHGAFASLSWRMPPFDRSMGK